MTERDVEEREREFSFKEKMQKIELGEIRLSKEKERFLIEQSIQDKQVKKVQKKARGMFLKTTKALFNIISIAAISAVILALVPSTRDYILYLISLV